MMAPDTNPLGRLSEYELRHLTTHLEVAGRLEDLYRLLALSTENEHNAWFQAKASAHDLESYTDDVNRAWRAAEAHFQSNNVGIAIGRQVRCALLTASVNNLMRNVPAGLAAILVAREVWTPDEALDYASRQRPESSQRPEILEKLAPYLPLNLLPQGLALAQEVETTYAKAVRQAQSALELAERGFLEQALAEVGKIDTPELQGRALGDLAHFLPENLLPATLAIAERIRDDDIARQTALIKTILRLVTLGRPEQALSEAQRRNSLNDRAQILRALATHLSGPLRDKAQREAEMAISQLPEDMPYFPPPAIRNTDLRAKALLVLARRLANLGHPEQVLDEVQRAEGAQNWGLALDVIAPLLTESLALRALRLMQLEKEKSSTEVVPYERERAFASLILRMAVLGHPDVAMTEIQHVPYKYQLVALSEIAHLLPAALMQFALALVKNHQEEASKDQMLEYTLADAMRAVAVRLGELGQPEPALELAAQIKSELRLEDTLFDLAPYLSVELLPRALALARSESTYNDGKAFIRLVARMAEIGSLQEAWQLYEANQDPKIRGEALKYMAPYLPKPGLEKLLQLARQITTFHTRSTVLTSTVPFLPKRQRFKISMEAVESIQEVPGASGWKMIIDTVLSHLSKTSRTAILQEAWSAACQIDSEYARCDHMVHLASYVPRDWLKDAVHEPGNFENVGARADLLIGLVPYLTEGMRSKAIREALAIVQEYELPYRTEVMAKIAPYLPNQLKKAVLTSTITDLVMIKEEKERVKILGRLSAYLPMELHSAALKVAREIEDPISRGMALVGLAPHISDSLLWETLDFLQRVGDTEIRIATQASLASLLPEANLLTLMSQVQKMETVTMQHRAAARLAPRLAELAYVAEAFELIRLIPRSHWEVDANTKSETLTRLAAVLLDRFGVDAILSIVEGLEDALDRAEMLLQVSLLLPDALKPRVLQAALSWVSSSKSFVDVPQPMAYRRGEILAELVPWVAKLLSPKKAMDAVRMIPHDSQHKPIAQIAASLPENLIPEAFEMTQRMSFEWGKHALASLAPRLPKSLLLESVKWALRLGKYYGPDVLLIVSPYFNSDIALETEALLRANTDFAWAWTKSLEALIPRLAALGHLDRAQDALTKLGTDQFFSDPRPVWFTDDDLHRLRAIVLPRLAPYMTEDQRAEAYLEALEAGCKIQNVHSRIQTLITVVPWLPEKLKTKALREALDSCHGEGMNVLASLLPLLSEEQLKELLLAAQNSGGLDRILTMVEEVKSQDALATLLPLLTEEQLEALLVAAQNYGGLDFRIQAMIKKAAYIPEAIMHKVWKIAAAALRFHSTDDLVTLAPQIASQPASTIYPLWVDALSKLATGQRESLLTGISSLQPVIGSLGGEEAAIEIYTSIQDVGRWWP
ncbi:MAG: hypothetical protein P8173_14950 [Gammaproteobacteria bacterium]|jgi:hypothetical protein